MPEPFLGRRRTTRRAWPSPTWSARGWTSWATGRSGARATPTTSPPRWRASTSTTRARSSAARGPSISCPGWWGRSGGRRPWEPRRRVPARARAWADQGDGAGAVHDGPADAGRALRGRPGARAGLRGRRQRGAARPAGGGRGRRADRRAVAPAPPRAGAALRRGGDRPGAGGRGGRDGPAHLPRVRGGRGGQAGGLSLPRRARRLRASARSPWRPPSRGSISRSCARSPTRSSCSACSTSPTRRWRAPSRSRERIRAALEHVEPERLVLAPDCGMKYLPRETAFGKLRALARGAALVRAELDRS